MRRSLTLGISLVILLGGHNVGSLLPQQLPCPDGIKDEGGVEEERRILLFIVCHPKLEEEENKKMKIAMVTVINDRGR